MTNDNKNNKEKKMGFSLSNLFKAHVDTKTTSIKNNKVSIETRTDIMFQIGKDLGEIKNGLNNVDKQFKDIHKKLNEHNYRISQLEKAKNVKK